MDLSKQQQIVLKDQGADFRTFKKVDAGHMSYRRFVFSDINGKSSFVKAFDKSMSTDKKRSIDARHHLVKEAGVYKHLSCQGFLHIPSRSSHSADMLILEGLLPEDGWHWRLPKDVSLHEKYVSDIVSTLKLLEKTPAHARDSQHIPTLQTFQNEGWSSLPQNTAINILSAGTMRWSEQLHPSTVQTVNTLKAELRNGDIYKQPGASGETVFNHHDARQANIAWHPEQGVKIVDWSWADAGLLGGDTTMFLVDLHKSGYPVTDTHLKEFNPNYARMLVGYWLRRSGELHREGNEKVRLQQFVSAISALELLERYKKSGAPTRGSF